MKKKTRMIWALMEGQRTRYGAAVLALIAGSCVMYLVPLIPQLVIDGALSPSPEASTGFVRRAVAFVGGRDAILDHLWLAGLAIVLLTGLSGVFAYFRARWATVASQGIARNVRDALYDQLQHTPCRYHDHADTGDQIQRCTSDVETLRQFLASQIVEIGRASLMLLVPIPLMLAIDVRMTIASVLVIPPIVAFSYFYFRRVRSSFLLVDESEGRLTSTLQENLTGIRVVRAFCRQEFEKEKFGAQNDEYRSLDNRLYQLMATYWSMSDFLCMGQKAIVVAVGGYWLASGQLQVGTFYFFLSAVNMFIWPIRMMGRILTDLGKATVAIDRIDEILSEPRESAPSADVPVADPAPDHEGEVVFEDVSFAHAGNAVLRGVSFRIEPGQTFALLGPSGSGKSTVVSLLMRFYDPDGGRILLDGVDITRLDRKAVRKRIAVVMQEPFLYSKTIHENIRLGRSSAGDTEVTLAAQAACVHDAIEAFEKRYQTLVGERGVTLSGGQRQRLALARALLDEPSLLILDDALSAVDTDTEANILAELRARGEGQTTLLIAHRLSTVMHADQIAVLDGGRIVELGTHGELVAREGLYRRLWNIQSALEESLHGDLQATAGEDGRVG